MVLLGKPDEIEEESVTIACKWEKVISDGKEYKASIDFTRGVVTRINVSIPNAPEVELAIVI